MFFDTQCLHYKSTQNKEPDINIELDSSSDPPGIYLFKVNNGNARTMCKICLNLIIKTQKRCAWYSSFAFIANFEQTPYIVLLFPLLLWTINCQLRRTSKFQILWNLKKYLNQTSWMGPEFMKRANLFVYHSYWDPVMSFLKVFLSVLNL